MGNDLGALQANGTFGPEEVNRLRKRFRKLDADGSGTLSVDEIMALPNVSLDAEAPELSVENFTVLPEKSGYILRVREGNL